MPRKLIPLAIACISLPLALSGATGCSWLRGACADVLPLISQGQSFAADAAQALEQAEKFIDMMPLGDINRTKLIEAVEKAHIALRAAASALASTADACVKPDVVSIFQAFIDAWQIIRVIVANTSTMDPAKFAVAGPRFKVLDPMIYQLAARQKAPR